MVKCILIGDLNNFQIAHTNKLEKIKTIWLDYIASHFYSDAATVRDEVIRRKLLKSSHLMFFVFRKGGVHNFLGLSRESFYLRLKTYCGMHPKDDKHGFAKGQLHNRRLYG